MSNISIHTTEELLYKYFSKFGGIESIKILPPKVGNNMFSRNIAFINYFKPEYALKAKNEMEGKIILGNPIKIKWGKNNQTLQNLVSPTLSYDTLQHIYIKFPTEKGKLELINKLAKIIAEVLNYLFNFKRKAM